MKTLLGSLVLAALTAGQAYAACEYPKAPQKFPDGSLAKLEEMLAAKKDVAKYNGGMEAYLSCIQSEHDAALAKGGDQLTPEQKAEMTSRHAQKHNAAVDELEGVAQRFNEQVKAFKAKNAKNKK